MCKSILSDSNEKKKGSAALLNLIIDSLVSGSAVALSHVTNVTST